MNEDWLSLEIEKRIPTIYVLGGADAVVPPASGCPHPAADNVKLLPQYGHSSLIEPIDGDDLRFKILKRFLIRECGIFPPTAADSESVSPLPLGDILFDVYSRAVEPYYIRREFDRLLTAATTGAHAWVSGPSGVGKTAALRRLAELAGWRLYHIMLGSYQGLSPLELMREICSELHERLGLVFEQMPRPVLAMLLPQFRKALRLAAQQGPFAILVEEIPISTESDLAEFIAGISHLAMAADTDGMPSRVVWLFSSIGHPELNQSSEHLKFRERVQLLKASPWSAEDLSKLAQLIGSHVDAAILKGKTSEILSHARGSPRFVKIVFRRIRNEGSQCEHIDNLLGGVARDLFGNA